MTFDPTKPYNDLPLLPPAVDIESKALLKACIDARAALAELKSVGALIPNQAVLINTIPLLEAQAKRPFAQAERLAARDSSRWHADVHLVAPDLGRSDSR